MEILKYKYKEIFHLTAQQVEDEPSDDFFTNLFIHEHINKKQEKINKHG